MFDRKVDSDVSLLNDWPDQREATSLGQWFEQLNKIGIALSRERDLTRLLETILVVAKRIANADGALRPGMSGLARIDGPPLSILQRAARFYARVVRADFWL